MEIKIYKDELYTKILSFLIIFLPFLYQYKGLFGMSFGETLLLPVILIGLCKCDLRNVRFCTPLLILYILATFSGVLNINESYFVFADYITIFIKMIYYAALIFVSRNFFDYDSVKHIYVNIVFLTAIYIIIQYLYNKTTGVRLPNYIDYNWLLPAEAVNKDPNGIAISTTYRPAGIFLEPSYFSLFAFPAAVSMIFDKKKNLIKFGVFCISMLISACLSGIVGIIIILCIYYFTDNKKKGIGNKLLSFLILVFWVVALVNSSFSENALSRLSSGGSFQIRFLNGPVIYSKLDFLHQIIGTGLNNTTNYLTYYNIHTGINYYGLTYNGYSSTVFSCLNACGILAFITLGFFVVRLIRQSSRAKTKCLCFIFVFLMLYESILFSYRFAFFISVLFYMINEDQEMEGEL